MSFHHALALTLSNISSVSAIECWLKELTVCLSQQRCGRKVDDWRLNVVQGHLGQARRGREFEAKMDQDRCFARQAAR